MSDKIVRAPHALSLASGRQVGDGDTVTADELGPDDRWLDDEGYLLDAPASPADLEGQALKQRARDLDVSGRSNMSTDELRAAIEQREAEIKEGGNAGA